MRLEGEQLGHYRLTRFIQSGGMGEVYLAEDLTLSRQVAIKVMKTEPVRYPDAQASKDAARLFQREMQAISMLDHAHILALHEAGEQRIGQDNITYMVMPYCPEGSLSDWIHHYHSTQPLSPEEVGQILQQAADALQYAHDKKILHLDVKPSNFLVRRQHDPSQLPNLLLADFGVAKMAATSKLSGTVRGTLEYMAPEQLAGNPIAASDQYALGIMVYELLTGRTPFQGTLPQAIPHMHANVDPKAPSVVNPSLPAALDTVVLRALAKKPQDRFVSVKEFASAFATTLKPSAAQHLEVNKVLNRTATPDIKVNARANTLAISPSRVPDSYSQQGQSPLLSRSGQSAGKIVLEQGLIFGAIISGVTTGQFVPIIGWLLSSFAFLVNIACYFLAGLFTARRTGRISKSLLACLLANALLSVFVVISNLMLTHYDVLSLSISIIEYVILGTGIGALGGLLGRSLARKRQA